MINDCKLFGQIHNRNIDGYISRDISSQIKIVEKIKNEFNLNFEFIDFTQPLKKYLDKLF